MKDLLNVLKKWVSLFFVIVKTRIEQQQNKAKNWEDMNIPGAKLDKEGRWASTDLLLDSYQEFIEQFHVSVLGMLPV